MYEDIIQEIKDKEKELGITNGYKGWTNEMYDFLYKKEYNKTYIYDEIIGTGVMSPVTISNKMSDIMDYFLNEKGNNVGVYCSDSVLVYKGKLGDCNDEFCKEHGIPIIDFKQPTGTFVITPGSLSLAYNDKLRLPIENDYIYRKIMNKLGGERLSNDILIDGYKVAGCSHTMGKRIMHLSFTVDLNLIRNICTKRMEKEPKGITELIGLGRGEFIDRLYTWLLEK